MKFKYQQANRIFVIFLILVLCVTTLEIDENLSAFVKEYFTLILLILLINLSFIIYDILRYLNFQKNKKMQFNSENRELINKLTKLSYEEKNILSLFIDSKTQERSLAPNDQAVSWLETIKFIHNTGKVDGNKRVFRIEPTLSKHLSQNPNSLY